MRFFQLFSISFEALKERRLRASLTVLMVIMGASLIVALDGTGNGFTNFINDQFSSLGANVIILQQKSGNVDVDKAMVDTISKFSGVQDTVPYIQQIVPISSKGETHTTVMVGLDQSKLPLLFPTVAIDTGQFVAQADSVGILFGSEAAKKSTTATDTFADLGQTVSTFYQRYEGDKLTVTRRSFSVRGVLKVVGSGVVPVDQMVFVSIAAANTFFDRSNNYDGMYVVTDSPDLNKNVQQLIRNRYGNDVSLTSPQSIADMINQIKSGVYMFISVVAYVSLLVASVGIITTLHTSMMERIKEIGLLKALGFNNHLVLTLFIEEAVIIGVLGATLGILSGAGLAFVMTFLVGRAFSGNVMGTSLTSGITPSFSLGNFGSTWLICVALSMISGFYPAWRASKLDPVVALRHE